MCAFARFTRPRSAAEALALLLTLLATVTLCLLVSAAIVHGQQLGMETSWVGVLLAGAAIARTERRWQPHFDGMTRQRARQEAGIALLLYGALCLSWHLVSVKLGDGDSFGLLGPASAAPFAYVVLTVLVIAAVILIAGLPVGEWGSTALQSGKQAAGRARQRRVLAAASVQWTPIPEPEEIEPVVREKKLSTVKRRPAQIEPPAATGPVEVPGDLPSIELFTPAPKAAASAPADLEDKAQRIEETLASFNVGAHVVDQHPGPVVTQFDVQPDRGVKVRRITELQNDLALALAAPSIRIQAPVPGKPVVGIEIPNSSASMVALRDILETSNYQASAAPLRVALGKDVAGKPVVIDLAKMPHLLIAGATGSGKSVCVNGIISCLLYQNTPEDVRLMMVDPKMVELTVYNGVPHLLSPVVTQMDKVVGVLQWAIREMERRYQLFADTAVRNIGRYNEKMLELGLKKLPYIVLVVDELADLMMVAPEDVEDAICRLAQLARAAGIHLVIATQRPSVDVVTGLIKANFPARIAFAMTSQIDSRTILDRAGAEKLLGRGDMLYQPPDGPAPVRLQGAYLSDQEIEGLVEFWKRSPLQQASQRVPEEEFVEAEKQAVEEGDELLDDAVRVVREFQHASVSLLQRRLRVGYARAARLMDQLEERGVVGAADGSRQRPVLPVEDDLDSLGA